VSEGEGERDAPRAPVRLLADENFPGPSVRLLREAGHDVAWVSEGRSGIDDRQVLAWGRHDGRIVLTFDRDLAERLVRHRDPPPAGLVFLRFMPTDPLHAGRVVAALLDRRDLGLSGRLTVVDHQKVRQRPLLSAD
jgi:predicted nuclease of predicted toxin-antitoxin system